MIENHHRNKDFNLLDRRKEIQRKIVTRHGRNWNFWLLCISYSASAFVFFLIIGQQNVDAAASPLSCHECAVMYDGAHFLGVSNFSQCQFFEADLVNSVSSDGAQLSGSGSYLRTCPRDEKCCFSLREYMYTDFWGHSAAAEIFLHGCCSSLNKTREMHHLLSTIPPSIVDSREFKAKIMSQTIRDESIQTRVMYCNTNGCNSERIPWSVPILMKDLKNKQRRRPKQNSDLNSVENLIESVESLEDSFEEDFGAITNSQTSTKSESTSTKSESTSTTTSESESLAETLRPKLKVKEDLTTTSTTEATSTTKATSTTTKSTSTTTKSTTTTAKSTTTSEIPDSSEEEASREEPRSSQSHFDLISTESLENPSRKSERLDDGKKKEFELISFEALRKLVPVLKHFMKEMVLARSSNIQIGDDPQFKLISFEALKELVPILNQVQNDLSQAEREGRDENFDLILEESLQKLFPILNEVQETLEEEEEEKVTTRRVTTTERSKTTTITTEAAEVEENDDFDMMDLLTKGGKTFVKMADDEEEFADYYENNDRNSAFIEELNVIDLLLIDETAKPKRNKVEETKVDKNSNLRPKLIAEKLRPKLKNFAQGSDDDFEGQIISGDQRELPEVQRSVLSRFLEGQNSVKEQKNRNSVCECHCNCPTLVCPTAMPLATAVANGSTKGLPNTWALLASTLTTVILIFLF